MPSDPVSWHSAFLHLILSLPALKSPHGVPSPAALCQLPGPPCLSPSSASHSTDLCPFLLHGSHRALSAPPAWPLACVPAARPARGPGAPPCGWLAPHTHGCDCRHHGQSAPEGRQVLSARPGGARYQGGYRMKENMSDYRDETAQLRHRSAHLSSSRPTRTSNQTCQAHRCGLGFAIQLSSCLRVLSGLS